MSNFNRDDALAWSRYTEVDGQERRDTSAPLQPSKSCRRQHECIIVAGVQFPEPGIQVAANREERRRRREVHELGNPSDAARADSGRLSQLLPDAVDVLLVAVSGAEHYRITWILSRQYSRDLEPFRKNRRHVLAAVNGEVDFTGKQRIFDFFHEQALATDF